MFYKVLYYATLYYMVQTIAQPPYQYSLFYTYFSHVQGKYEDFQQANKLIQLFNNFYIKKWEYHAPMLRNRLTIFNNSNVDRRCTSWWFHVVIHRTSHEERYYHTDWISFIADESIRRTWIFISQLFMFRSQFKPTIQCNRYSDTCRLFFVLLLRWFW